MTRLIAASIVLCSTAAAPARQFEPPQSTAMATYKVTFTNDAPYAVDFYLNGSGPLSRPLRVAPREVATFNLEVSPGFFPYVRIRQPDGDFQDSSLPLRDQRYRFRRTSENRVVIAFE